MIVEGVRRNRGVHSILQRVVRSRLLGDVSGVERKFYTGLFSGFLINALRVKRS